MVRAAIAAGMTALLLAVSPARAQCEDILPCSGPGDSGSIGSEDLIRLRQIGHPEPNSFMLNNPLGVSPDGKTVALVLVRADPQRNAECRALVAVDIETGQPTILDRGGEFVMISDIQRGLYYRVGATAPVTPTWSPDGKAIAYLRRDRGRTQAWLARADGGGARQMSFSTVDVDAVVWSRDGRRLLISSRPAMADLERAIDREGLSGWLYDDRIVPNSGIRPKIRAVVGAAVSSIDLATGVAGPAGVEDSGRVTIERIPGTVARLAAVARDGREAWTERSGRSPLAPRQVRVRNRDGTIRECAWQACQDITGLIWSGDDLLLLRREGWAKSRSALYRWSVGAKGPARVLVSDAVLHNCLAAGSRLVCTREAAKSPRHLVTVDPFSGRVTMLFDPNPDFARFDLGKVVRLKVRNAFGLESWADLVLPPGPHSGDKLPLVVVQYRSLGFLRGGTGNDVPIFPLAARGFAVLSVERPDIYAARFGDHTSIADITAANLKDWAERRSILSSLERSVAQAIASYPIDPARLGITGQSDGSSGVRFALLNTKLFAAASISTCCIEQRSSMEVSGTGFADIQRRMGYPAATADADDFWRPYSLALNAARIDTPLLMQLSEDEYILALETFTALREHNKPVEMYLFPGEYHSTWQPAHRLAMYERNIDWFDFWLNRREDPSPVKVEQYRRWRAFRSGSAATADR